MAGNSSISAKAFEAHEKGTFYIIRNDLICKNCDEKGFKPDGVGGSANKTTGVRRLQLQRNNKNCKKKRMGYLLLKENPQFADELISLEMELEKVQKIDPKVFQTKTKSCDDPDDEILLDKTSEDETLPDMEEENEIESIYDQKMGDFMKNKLPQDLEEGKEQIKDLIKKMRWDKE